VPQWFVNKFPKTINRVSHRITGIEIEVTAKSNLDIRIVPFLAAVVSSARSPQSVLSRGDEHEGRIERPAIGPQTPLRMRGLSHNPASLVI
jgi:hypothetical protein